MSPLPVTSSSSKPERAGNRGVLPAAMAGTVTCALPVFLVGAVAVQIRDSLHFGSGTLGTLVALYYLGAAISSVSLGRVVEAVGALRTMRVACAVSAGILGLIGGVVHSVPLFAGLLITAGVSSAAMQPASNTYLSRRMRQDRQGVAFGVKQSAVPLTTLLAGLAVPALALTAGWRWAFGLAAILAAAAAVLMPRPSQSWAARRADAAGRSVDRTGARQLWVLAGGFGLGLASASCLTAFLASSAVAAGSGRAAAGLLVSVGGAAAVVGRIVAGWNADRRGGDPLPAVAGMLTVGAAGYVALALVSANGATWAYVPAVVVVFGSGWGWNGLFNLAVVRDHPGRPGWATGVTQTGGRLGGVVGPFLFGQIAAHASYSSAWLAAAGACLVGAAVMLVSRRMALSGSCRQPGGPT